MQVTIPTRQARRPVMLVILDGFGWREDSTENAVAQAETPNFDRLWAQGPRSFLRTCGHDVGLPLGQMGNSEVGHLNIGAGRVVMQELPRITMAVEDGSLAQAPALRALIASLHKTGGTAHLMGLVSPGGVHSHQTHAAALAHILVDAGVPVAFHIFTDGRDTPPQSARADVAELRRALPPQVQLATISGRYYAMDRDKRWERVQMAYNAIVSAHGPRDQDPDQVLEAAYASGITDEFVPPTVLHGYDGMQDGDGIVSFNFRADRIRQLMNAILDVDFSGFPRETPPQLAGVVAMTRYSDDLADRLGVLFAPQNLEDLLGEVVARAGRRQLRMAETEKFPHVTYFLNGGREALLPGEDRIMVPSPKVATYDLQPEMSAPELTDKAVAAIGTGQYDLIVLNYANPDMVGHTGNLQAAIKAVETVDAGLGRLVAAVDAQGGVLLATADHGNCEMMRDPVTGEPHTAHTLNAVPLVLSGRVNSTLADGRLADLAPTILALMGLEQPLAMTGQSLIAGG